LASAIESVLLVAGDPIGVKALVSTLQRPRSQILDALEAVADRMNHGIRLQRAQDAVQLATAPENAEVVRRYRGLAKPAPLSRAGMETLSVVAYRQPVTRSEIEAMRGVNSDRALQTLLARDLVEERGPRSTIGTPMQFGTSFGFLQYFGLASLKELPPALLAAQNDAQPSLLGFRQMVPAQGEAAQPED